MDKFHPSQGVRCFYIRGRHGEPVGLVMTQVVDGVARMGWSLCRRSADTFRKSEAKIVAFARLAPIPATELGMGIRDSAMNRALTVLAGDMSVPQTIRSGAKRELNRRSTAGVPEGVQVCWGLDPKWPGNPSQQAVVVPEPEPTFFQRLRRALGL